MDYAPPAASGSRIQELGDRLIVRFRPHRSWPALAFVGFWLTFWTFGGIAAFSKLLIDGDAGDRAFMLFWLCGWAFGECAAILTLAWGLFGREVLTVTPVQLEIRRAIGRFARTKRFDTVSVRDLKATRMPVEEGQSRTPYWLEISLPKKTVLVGDGLGEREAEYIASVLMSRIRPRRGWSDDLTAIVAEPPSEPSFRWRNAVFPVIVVGLLAYLGYSTLSDRSSGARPPAAKGFSDPRAYAVATTRSSLSAANMRILGRVDCGDRATWREWACTARVEGTSGYLAGRRFTYRCVPTRGELPDGRQGDLVECGAVEGT